MIAELKDHSRITLPPEVVKELGLKKGDKFEVTLKDGGIFLFPVIIPTKQQQEYINIIIEESQKDIDKLPVYSSVDELINALHININAEEPDETADNH